MAVSICYLITSIPEKFHKNYMLLLLSNVSDKVDILEDGAKPPEFLDVSLFGLCACTSVHRGHSHITSHMGSGESFHFCDKV